MPRRAQPDVWATGLRLPPTWVCRSEPGPPGSGVTVVAGPGGGVATGAIAPQLVVRLTQTGADEERWRDDPLGELGELPGFEVEDEDRLDLGMQDVGYLRYSHQGPPGSPELLSERWSWRGAGHLLTLTGTLAREDYEIWCDLFEAVAATVDATRLSPAASVPGPP